MSRGRILGGNSPVSALTANEVTRSRPLSVLTPTQKHPRLNAFFGLVTGAVVLTVGFIMLFSTVVPRVFGYVSLNLNAANLQSTYPESSQLIVKKIREHNAGEIDRGEVIIYQPDDDTVDYKAGRVRGKAGVGSRVVYTVRGDGDAYTEGRQVSLDQVRGLVIYHLPFMGVINGSMSETVHSFSMVITAAFLLEYAGWQIGTAIINGRDPQAQARKARLRAAAAAGRVEADRRRLQRDMARNPAGE